MKASNRKPRLPRPPVPQDPRARAPTSATRKAVLARDGHRCKKCHSDVGLELNHIKPYSKGGETTVENLHTLCALCHGELSWLWCDQPPIPYERWLRCVGAGHLIKMLLAIAGEIESPLPVETVSAILGLTREQARWLLFAGRA